MKKMTAWVGIAFLPMLAFAAEPTNLNVYKQSLIRYHDSGHYDADMQQAVDHAMQYLQQRIKLADFHGKKPAIVLDIDETSLSNYPDLVRMDFGGTPQQVSEAEDNGQDLPILPTLRLFQFAKQHQIAVFFVTGRRDVDRLPTMRNLFAAGYRGYDGLFVRTPNLYYVTAQQYKSQIRKQLIDQGYDVLLSLGDQASDLNGGFVDRGFKVPNPYYFIP